MLAFLMIYFFSLDILLGLVGCLLVVLLGCGIVLANVSCKKPTWRLPHPGGVAALVDAASLHTLVAGSSGSGDTPSLRDFGNDKRKRIRLTKKTNVRKRFGVDLGEQPIPKRWRAETLRDVYLGSLSLRELADYQVAQSHASRRSACRLFL